VKKDTRQTVTFIDLDGKPHVAFVKGKFEGDVFDLEYFDGKELTVAYDVPKQGNRSKNFYWK